MQKATDYIIVEGSSAVELQQQVMLFLKDGFIPTGGVCLVQTTGEGYKFLQAVVKYKEN